MRIFLTLQHKHTISWILCISKCDQQTIKLLISGTYYHFLSRGNKNTKHETLVINNKLINLTLKLRVSA